ncbi:hypothetical protein BDY24DRAFT_279442 [Mrakia frigida]|uniref:uncharacterized protein n=1 Tax=Mrakia frigida TaxID=29902 RepID=UPI003FCC17A0
MDDDDENLVDWGYDDDVEEVIEASGPIEEDEEDILASDGEAPAPAEPDPSPQPASSNSKPSSSSSSSQQPSRSQQSPSSSRASLRPPPSPSTSSSSRPNGHPLPPKLGPSPRLSNATPTPKDLPSRPSSALQPAPHLSDRQILSAEPISSNGSAPPPSAPARAPERASRSPTPEIVALPPGWSVRTSSTMNRPYYYHAATKTALWDPPAQPSESSSRSASSSKPAPARQEQQQSTKQEQQQQQSAKKVETSLASRIAVEPSAVSSSTISSSVAQRQEASRPSSSTGIPHSEHHQAYLDARAPSPPTLLNRLGAFAAPTESAEGDRSKGASSTLRGTLSPPRSGRTTAARSRSPPPLNNSRSGSDIALEREKPDERERERLREVERERERERGRALEKERLLEKERNNPRYAHPAPARRRSPPPFTSNFRPRSRSPPPHIPLRGPPSPPPRRREPSPGPYRRPFSRSPPPRPRQRSISPRRPRPISPPSRWPKPTEERVGSGGGWGLSARAGRADSPPPAARPLSSQRPPLDSRASNQRPPSDSRPSGSAVGGARAPAAESDARRDSDQGRPVARRPSSPPAVVVRGQRERSPPSRRSPPPTSTTLSEPRSQRAPSPSRGPSSHATAPRAPDDPNVLVHPSRAKFVGAAPSAPSSAAPSTVQSRQRPTVLVPPFAPVPGIRLRQELEAGRRSSGVILKGSDSNYSPIGSRPGEAPARRWGAPAPTEEAASSASTSNTPVDAPSSSTPRQDPSPRASTSSAPLPPPRAPRARGAEPAPETYVPTPSNSYHPSDRDYEDQRGRPTYDSRNSAGMSLGERERQRELRFRDASPRRLTRTLPPEEPWETKRIAERKRAEKIMMERRGGVSSRSSSPLERMGENLTC